MNCTIDSNLINNMDYNTLNSTLDTCESTCPKHYNCDYVLWMNNKLKELEKIQQMKNYLIELLERFKEENQLKNTEIAIKAHCNKVDITKYLQGKISITKTILDRLHIKPSKLRLKDEIITQIEKNNNLEQLIYIYNYLYRNNH